MDSNHRVLTDPDYKSGAIDHYATPAKRRILYQICTANVKGGFTRDNSGRGALFAARKRSGRKAASNGSWRSLSFVRFLRSRLKTIFVVLVSQASAAITGCVQDASYACKKRTPHSRHFRFGTALSVFPVALQAAVGRGVPPRRPKNENPLRNILIRGLRVELELRVGVGEWNCSSLRSLQAFRFLTQSGRAAGRAACPHAAAARWDPAPYRVLWDGR